ncbi:hypothetical protein EMIHUDRAFT_122094 [Emiliania huxleyi CCMP1516]|uniref:Myb-like domain-containing protein n=2 Tax=Emiliania huxleyi TaxID=2903 RepID=A0A0D3KTP6_EMIH1|nr:hypothetical protein EMIHUDRAFT_122094 [Emiliania huxleyi CCMP1516]EOD39131.1 hypothetical protein EMIHUDRAFT_122094 [Emiliania huxleyi CCMP1516]|eukprot:XP_005791560.1 hypothetical protein EMIHUDRAFT_122094 [Emiliania huxleyi CCMP1516]
MVGKKSTDNMASWTPEEDRKILQLYALEGRKWGRIADGLTNRSPASVRNRYLRIEFGQHARRLGLAKNRCTACGLPKLGHVCSVKTSGFSRAASLLTAVRPSGPTVPRSAAAPPPPMQTTQTPPHVKPLVLSVPDPASPLSPSSPLSPPTSLPPAHPPPVLRAFAYAIPIGWPPIQPSMTSARAAPPPAPPPTAPPPLVRLPTEPVLHPLTTAHSVYYARMAEKKAGPDI